MHSLLNQFYPERSITITTADPQYVTPAIKAMLRRKNRLMRSGRTDEAGAIAERIRHHITCYNSRWLRNTDTRKRPQAAWCKVREVMHGSGMCATNPVDGITAQVLNDHYASISSDDDYRLLTVATREDDISEWQVFRMLEKLRPTATGFDQLPAWFLKTGAPIFAAPLAKVFQQSLKAGIVPHQWKVAVITPIPKVAKPAVPSDFRPISITPILARTLEKHVVQRYIYPAMRCPPPSLSFADQFAFRPTGSTTAAVVALIHTVRAMLSENQYVHVIAFDFSKAFDSQARNADGENSPTRYSR